MKNMPLRLALAAAALVVVSVIANLLGMAATRVSAQLIPASGSAFPWEPLVSSDEVRGGKSTVDLDGHVNTLSFNYQLSDESPHPYAAMGVFLGERAEAPNYVDLSAFSKMILQVNCAPKNVLRIALHSIDQKISDPHDFDSYRVSTGYISCNQQSQTQVLDLRRLETPGWWLITRGLGFSNQADDYLDYVHSISIGSSPQSAVNVYSTINIEGVTFEGRSWLPLYLTAVATLAAWAVFAVWALRLHTQFLAEKLRADIRREAETVAPAKPVEFESRHDKERADVLQYMAAEYTNPELSMEMVVAAIGMNREKINNILREESELTFSNYLNKLRLSEAARLLVSKNVSVAEVVYAVGYKNVSYFNRLFKKTYDCTPNSYKSHVADKHS